jgi:Tol biopolymer transport system component
MSGHSRPNLPAASSASEESRTRLDSWKEIASYLGRSEKTVRRWEEREGLPVHRLRHEKRGSVYAYGSELEAWWRVRKETIEPEAPLDDSHLQKFKVRRLPIVISRPWALFGARNHGPLWMLAGMLLAALGLGSLWLLVAPRHAPPQDVQFQRITDSVGVEGDPAISPDGKMVAFVALAGNRHQIWVRLLAGGAPLQITHNEVDHQQPRWAPDSSSLIYYSASATTGEQGEIWEVPALGGPPRRIASALGGGDISRDGLRVAFFRSENGRVELAVAPRHGFPITVVTRLPVEDRYQNPRWSPDGHSIAFQREKANFETYIYAVGAAAGPVRKIAEADNLSGFSWLADGSGFVYSSSSGSTVLYPPAFNLRLIRQDGTGDRQLTFGDVSYVQPDVSASGKLVASRIISSSDIWKFPIGGSAEENTRRAIRITQQTGHIQTPSVSPDGKEVVYLSDGGGHGNLWVTKTDGSETRQITFEQDPAVAVGVPAWSPVGDQIVFILTRNGQPGQWLIHSDGSGLRRVIPLGIWASWSGNGRWIYFVALCRGTYCIEKIPADGGAPVVVRTGAISPALVGDSTLYFANMLKRGNGGWDLELRKAFLGNDHSEVLARIAGQRIPVTVLNFLAIPSPDGQWLAMPLTDADTSNLWIIPTGGGSLRRLTNFSKRPIIITRRVSWSPDSKYLYAAVAESDSDVVLLKGLLP